MPRVCREELGRIQRVIVHRETNDRLRLREEPPRVFLERQMPLKVVHLPGVSVFKPVAVTLESLASFRWRNPDKRETELVGAPLNLLG